MPKILITAFEPYDTWKSNASWLTLVELTRDLPTQPTVTTRLYPVDYGGVRRRLAEDLSEPFDYVFHLGQAPGTTGLQLEAIALNLASEGDDLESWPLEERGPLAYQSQLPLSRFALSLRGQGIPASISHHAGTYLCNAAFYWTQHFSALNHYPTRATLIHLPLESRQVVDHAVKLPSLPASTMAAALKTVLTQLPAAEA